MSRKQYVLSIDQGTTSTRAILFDREARCVSIGQREHQQIFPKPGWVEHDPLEIWCNTVAVIDEALAAAGATAENIAALGITNQRETTIVWDARTGEPIYNAIVWQDTRSQDLVNSLADGGAAHTDLDRFRPIVGESLSTYASITKIMWILNNVPGARERAQAGELLFGNPDTWLIWNLTREASWERVTDRKNASSGSTLPAPHTLQALSSENVETCTCGRGIHVTDVTNASRTMLMDLHTLTWREDICAEAGIPLAILPDIRSSAEVYAYCAPGSPLAGVPIAGDLGDQQAAAFGQACCEPGMAKNTYGTGCFMLMNTGGEPRLSTNGLITTVAYQIGSERPMYALEGSIAVAGSLIQWLRDNLGIIDRSAEVESLAASVPDTGGMYIVPAFSGLFAPYWRADARGVMVGLTRFNTKAHIARASLEATAFQTREVLDAMEVDAGMKLEELRVDGGMTANTLLMQFQADILGVPVVVPEVAETTALGAAYAAGIAVGLWENYETARANWREAHRWQPAMDSRVREQRLSQWKKAVTRSFDWV